MGETIALITQLYNQYSSLDEKHSKIGGNTGNILFYSALHSILQCDVVDLWHREKFEDYDAIVSTEMIWIQENSKPGPAATYWFEKAINTRFVPISIGLQSDTFKEPLHKFLIPLSIRFL